jgi:hypothetical protein
MKTIILKWYGPYTDETLERDNEFGNGIYLITGKLRYEREACIQYCGITENAFHNRLNNRHHRRNEITRDREYWLSEIIYPISINRNLLDISEKIIVYFWQPPLNERKKISIPEPTTIINHWFNAKGEPRINQRGIYRDLYDVISWDGEYWRTGNLNVWYE